MIRGTIPTFVLVFCLSAAGVPRAAKAVPREDIPRTAERQDQRISDANGDIPFGMTARLNPGEAAGRGFEMAAKPAKTVKKGQKFVDEDGDGYNDRRPETAPGNSGGNLNAAPAKAKSKDKSEPGTENSGNQGLRKGQGANPGLGIGGALERGIKKGQSTNKNSFNDASTNGQAGNPGNVRNNGKNRFDRNFEKYDRSSREK